MLIFLVWLQCGFVKYLTDNGRANDGAMNNAKASGVDNAAAQGSSDKPTALVQVLLADESAAVRESGHALLMAAGYSVLLASNGFEALALVAQHRPSVVIADIMLPRVDGFQLCSLLRRNPEHRDTPVIMLSPGEDFLDQARAELVGCHSHVCKTEMAARLGDLVRASA